MRTKVIFRMFKGEVLALFPEIAAGIGKPWECMSYANQGQHSGADCRGVIQASRLARPGEYRDLATELRRMGYRLNIVKRCTAEDYRCRCKQLREGA